MHNKPTALEISKMLDNCQKQIDKARSDPHCSQYVMVDVDTYKRIQDMTPEDYANIKDKFFSDKLNEPKE